MLPSFWKEILIAILLSLCCYFVYDKIYEHAAVEIVQEYNKKLDSKILKLESISTELSTQNSANAKVLAQNVDKILLASRTKTLTVIKEGKCTLSDDFLDSYNSVVLEGTAK